MNFFISFPSSKAENPFVRLLNEQLLAFGWQEYGTERFWLKPIEAFRLRKKVSLIHFHWPEYIWRSDVLMIRLMKAFAFVLYVSYLKAIGYRVTFSLHNLVPHFGKVYVPLEIKMRKWLLKNMDLVVGHSNNVYMDMELFYHIVPKRYLLVPHGLYENYHNTGFINHSLVEKLATIAYPKILLSYSSHEYKGSEMFLSNYIKGPHHKLCLILSGAVPPSLMKELQEHKVNVFYYREDEMGRKGFLSEKSLITLIQQCSFVALPYKEITTSGAYFLARTFKKPVIAPDLSFFKTTVADTEQQFLYSSPESLWKLMEKIGLQGNDNILTKESDDFYKWGNSAQKLAEAYSSLLIK